jgi:hypothetical protein
MSFFVDERWSGTLNLICNANVVFHWILNFMVLINHEFHENKYPTNISTFTVIPHYAVESGSYCPPFRSDV